MNRAEGGIERVKGGTELHYNSPNKQNLTKSELKTPDSRSKKQLKLSESKASTPNRIGLKDVRVPVDQVLQ